MDEMIRYIFGSLDGAERAIGGIYKSLNRQNKINRRTGVLFMVTGFCLLNQLKVAEQQQAQIKSLSKRVEELEVLKGE